jgi:hypothetical protein
MVFPLKTIGLPKKRRAVFVERLMDAIPQQTYANSMHWEIREARVNECKSSHGGHKLANPQVLFAFFVVTGPQSAMEMTLSPIGKREGALLTVQHVSNTLLL